MTFVDAFAPFVPPQFGIKLATESWERAESARLRELVFCHEQRLFAGSDRDDVDAIAQTIVAVDFVMGMAHRVVGTVRIHAETPERWYGSRLAIDPAYRDVYGLGSGLIYRAVTTAHARGCHTFLATVQSANEDYFRKLSWESQEELLVAGRPHVLMRAALRAYPAQTVENEVALLRSRRAS